MNEDKVYYPDEISDNPLPNQVAAPSFTTSAPESGDVQKPATTKNNPPPQKRAATELLSSALNTRSKKILAEFQFTVSGALAIGEFENGVSGDVRITANGVTARNAAGITTFALDGTTGDAVFAGSIQSGSVITGTVIVGNNNVILDGENKRIIINDGNTDRILIGQGIF